MIYYAATFTVLAGLHTTPLRSLSSKMVEPTEFGKLFTCVGVAVGVAQLISNSILLEAYADTVKSDPGFMYLLAAAFSGFALVIITYLYLFFSFHMTTNHVYFTYLFF